MFSLKEYNLNCYAIGKIFFLEIFGGASAMTPAQFRLVNGYSNQYWGWGGEDDDMYKRIDKSKLKIQRYKADISRYDVTGVFIQETI